MAHLLSALVGMMFLLSGMSKALHSGPFLSHIHQFGWVPATLAPVVCLFVTGLELGLATSLFLFVLPETTILVALATLVALTGVTLSGYVKGAIEHCGCYGRWLRLTPVEGMLLNSLLAVLLVAAWLLIDTSVVPLDDVRAPLLAVALGVFMAGRSAESPLVDMSPTKVGEVWNSEWVSEVVQPHGIPVLVAFLNPNCKLCMRWTHPLKQASQQYQWPLHVIVDESQIDKARDMLTPGFHVHALPSRKMLWLVDTVPTVFQLRDSVIEARWIGRVPQAWKPKGEDCTRLKPSWGPGG